MNAVQECPHGHFAIGILIGQRCAIVFGVPSLARHHTGMTAHGGVQINDKTKFFVGHFWQTGHDPSLLVRLMFLGPWPTGDFNVPNWGWLDFGGSALSIRTRKSNHAA